MDQTRSSIETLRTLEMNGSCPLESDTDMSGVSFAPLPRRRQQGGSWDWYELKPTTDNHTVGAS